MPSFSKILVGALPLSFAIGAAIESRASNDTLGAIASESKGRTNEDLKEKNILKLCRMLRNWYQHVESWWNCR